VNDTPNSSSHWVFCVMRPRLDVRLRNSAVDSSGSLPARSLARTDRKNHTRTRAPATISAIISQPLLSAARDAHDDQDEPDRGQDRSAGVEGACGVRRQGILDPAAQQDDRGDD